MKKICKGGKTKKNPVGKTGSKKAKSDSAAAEKGDAVALLPAVLAVKGHRGMVLVVAVEPHPHRAVPVTPLLGHGEQLLTDAEPPEIGMDDDVVDVA